MSLKEPPTALEKPVFKRQPFYCEENVWHLCQEPILASRSRHVLFVSNRDRACPMWSQRAGQGKPIVWDYHVILLVSDPVEIWDVDTTLGLPVRASDYIEQSFHPGLPEQYLPLFRMVEADQYVETFASDRSHMRKKDGSFRKPPPSWPLIGKKGQASNLMQFVDMEQAFLGEIHTLSSLWRMVCEREERDR